MAADRVVDLRAVLEWRREQPDEVQVCVACRRELFRDCWRLWVRTGTRKAEATDLHACEDCVR